MYRINKNILLSAVAVATLLAVSSCTGNSSDREENIFSEITGYKWSIDPYSSPDGTICDIEFGEDWDHYAYLAFNSDSTVDRWSSYDYATGTFTIDGDLITCLFVENLWYNDTFNIALDSMPNQRYVYQFKNNRLYKHDRLHRTKENKWVSEFKKEENALYYSNAGNYINDKYNAGFKHMPYDTTADGVSVVRRFDYRIETTYKNGKRNGIYKRFVDGHLSTFGTYTDGVPTGMWYFFQPTGEIYLELSNIQAIGHQYRADAITYFYGLLGRGPVSFDDNMDIHILSDWVYYDENGNITEKCTYD